MPNQQSAKPAEPGIVSCHDPAALIPPQFAFVFARSFLAVAPVRRNQIHASPLQSPTGEARLPLQQGLLIRQQLLPFLHGRSSTANAPHA